MTRSRKKTTIFQEIDKDLKEIGKNLKKIEKRAKLFAKWNNSLTTSHPKPFPKALLQHD